MSGDGPRLDAFEQRLGYRFERRELLERALTHRSYANERGLDADYERLEFLGDAVLGLATAERLFAERPRRSEGELTRRLGHLVSSRVLARRAAELGVGEALRLGVGEERSGGRTKASLLADALEAVLGAVFLDGGYEAARTVADRLVEAAVEAGEGGAARDSKTRLQELLQGRGLGRPDYREVGTAGPDHDKRFRIDCWLGDRLLGSGEGRSKKLAEQAAATAALEELTA